MPRRPDGVRGLIAALWLCGGVVGDEPIKPTTTATESRPATPAAGHSLHGEAFNDGPRGRARLLPGMGNVRFPVSTTHPDAQSFVNQGVAQLHSFYYYEAERSFRQAAAIDRDCAMAYWGMAMANVNHTRRARGFLTEARARASRASPLEIRYIEALEALHKDSGSDAARKREHLLALETLVQEFPGDLEARAWLAMVTWQNAASDGIGSRQAVDTLLDGVLDAEPMHPGAHHYRIHLWDGPRPARAERSAALYAGTAPGIAHAWHMPGHTYTSLKRYREAAYQQEGSARVDHAAMARDRIMPFQIHNYAHNNQWLATSLSHIGRARDAIAVARNLVDQPRDPDQNGKNDGGSPQRSGRARWSEVLTRYELWDELIAATTAGDLDWSDIAAERKEKAYTLGLAHAARRDLAGLAAQIQALRALAAEEGRATSRGSAPANSPVQNALAELEGHQHLAKGEVVLAFERFARATTMRPEALARAHLIARNFGFAEGLAEKAVSSQPKQVPPLAAQVEILAAIGKPQEARTAYQSLLSLAGEADRDLPVFRRLAPLVAGWGTTPPPPSTRPRDATDDATIQRIDLATLGPLVWAPYDAPPFTLPESDGRAWALKEHSGKNVVLLFFLGGKCPHCLQQLQAFSKEVKALQALRTEVVAVANDDPDALKDLKANPEKIAFLMPLLSDSRLETFKAYRAFDDFEGLPLHGTFLIDARGKVRFQRISSEPFLDVEFIKTEAARVNRLNKS